MISASGPEALSVPQSNSATMRWATLSGLTTLALAVLVPAAVIAWSTVASLYLIAGAVSWALAVALKMGGVRLVGLIFAVRISAIWRAVAAGVWSAFTELGFALLVFLLAPGPLRILYVLAVGLGATCTEILYLAAVGIVRRPATPWPPPNWIEGAKRSYLIQHTFFIERMLASAGHVAARALIYVSVSRNSLWPGLIAFVAFAGIDGVAQYGHLKRWNWFRPATSLYYYGGVVTAITVEVSILFTMTHRIGMSWRFPF